MKILHWNIHGWADADGVDNVDRVIDLVREVDPDVISFVEVDEEWGNPSKLRRVAETLDYYWAFVPAFEYREEGGFGNALLSRIPFASIEQWQLLPPSLYDGTEPSEPRALLLAELRHDAGRLRLGTTHFPRSDAHARAQATERLLKILDDHMPWPLIVCGDFNQPASVWLDSTQADLENAVTTYPTNNPTENIDYLAFHNLSPVRLKALANSASDHLPVLSQLDLNGT